MKFNIDTNSHSINLPRKSHIDDHRSQGSLRFSQWPPKYDFSMGKPRNLIYNLVRNFGCTFAKFVFRVKFTNKQNIDYVNEHAEGHIFSSNHNSGMDPFYFASQVNGKIHTLALDNPLLDFSLFRIMFEKIGVIAVAARGNRDTLYDARMALSSDFSLLIYPEANFVHKYRNVLGHTGIAILSAKTGKPIMPIGILGLDYHYFLLVSPPFNRRITVDFGIPRYVKEEYRVKGDERIDPDIARGITDELMYDIRRMSHYAGLTPEHRDIAREYYKNFKTDQYTYQNPDLC